MTLLIAEIGWNFMGDMDLAKDMVQQSKNSGATLVKFQYWQEKYLKKGAWDEDGRRKIYTSAQLNEEKINQIDYLTNIIKETLRLHTPAPDHFPR